MNTGEIIPAPHLTQERSDAQFGAREGPQIVEAPTRKRRAVKRILLADDDPGVREMLGRVLESEKYVVSYAATGWDAAMQFVADPPDLVLLDLNMPGGDGWLAFGIMNVTHPVLPVIIITARSNQFEKAAILGVDALMEKPLNLPVLLRAIKYLVDQSTEERARRIMAPNFKTIFLDCEQKRPSNQ